MNANLTYKNRVLDKKQQTELFSLVSSIFGSMLMGVSLTLGYLGGAFYPELLNDNVWVSCSLFFGVGMVLIWASLYLKAKSMVMS